MSKEQEIIPYGSPVYIGELMRIITMASMSYGFPVFRSEVKRFRGKVSEGHSDSDKFFSFKNHKGLFCGIYVNTASLKGDSMTCSVLSSKDGISEIVISGRYTSKTYEVESSRLVD